MTDIDLLVLGCAVSFIAVAGAYTYLRECYQAHEEAREAGPVPARQAHESGRAA